MQIKQDLSDKIILIKQINEDLKKQGYSVTLPEDESKVTFSSLAAIPDATEDTGDDVTVNDNTSVVVTYKPDADSDDNTKQMTFKFRRLDLEHIKTNNKVTNVSNEEYLVSCTFHDESGAKVTEYNTKLNNALATVLKLGERTLGNGQQQQEDKVKGHTTFNFVADTNNMLVVGQLANIVVETRAKNFGEITTDSDKAYYKYDTPLNISSLTVNDEAVHLYFPVDATEVPNEYFMGQSPLGNAVVELTDKITSIGASSFKNSITDLSKSIATMPSQITSIGAEAFSGSSSESYTLPETVTTVGDNCLGTVHTLTVLGNTAQYAKVVLAKAGGDSCDYRYDKNYTNAVTADNHADYTFVTLKYGNSKLPLTKDELEQDDLVTDTTVPGFNALVTDVDLGTNLTSIGNNWFNHVTVPTVHAEKITNFSANCFESATITDLYLGDAPDGAYVTGAFKGATITNVHVPTSEVKNRLSVLEAFTQPNLANVVNWVVAESTEETGSFPSEMTSSGLTYGDTVAAGQPLALR